MAESNNTISVQRRQQVVKYLQEAKGLLNQQVQEATMSRNGLTEGFMERVCRAVMPNGDYATLRKYGFSVQTIYNTEYVREALRSVDGEAQQPDRPKVAEILGEAYQMVQKANTEADLQDAIAKVDEASQVVKDYTLALDEWHQRRMRLPELVTPF